MNSDFAFLECGQNVYPCKQRGHKSSSLFTSLKSFQFERKNIPSVEQNNHLRYLTSSLIKYWLHFACANVPKKPFFGAKIKSC